MTALSQFAPTAKTVDAAGRVTSASWALSFAPPALENPIDIYLNSANRRAFMDGDKDYRIHLPADAAVNPTDAGDVQLLGGRNVVLIGGEIRYSYSTQGQSQRGLYIKGPTGTVHVEGLLIGGSLYEGIDIDTSGHRGSVVQIQNCKIDSHLVGSQATNHSDAIQCWNGPHRLLVDGLSAPLCDYQGFMLQPQQFGGWVAGDFGTWEFHRVAISNTGAYCIYDNTAGLVQFNCSDVWLNPGGASSGTLVPSKAIHPSPGSGITFDVGPAPEDPCLTAGRNYQSPGYLVAT